MTTETTKITITLTTEQRLRLEKLRSTTMSGERSDNPKTLEEQIYAAIEKGLYSLEYGRKQYQEKQLGAKLFRRFHRAFTSRCTQRVQVSCVWVGKGNEIGHHSECQPPTGGGGEAALP